MVIDKKGNFSFLFKGFRKHKYTVTRIEKVNSLNSNELSSFDLLFVILYDFKDVFDLLLLKSIHSSIIVGSENSKILKKLKSAEFNPVVDLSGSLGNVNTNFLNCVNEFFN